MVTRTVESNRTMINTNPQCEPQLGRRGLYRAIGGQADSGAAEMAMLWVLNLSDGANSLLDIAERANMPFAAVEKAAHVLEQHGLLVEIADGYTT
jgi:aminopeptidase-like protein